MSSDSMEQVSYKLHEQICKFSLRKTSHFTRSLLEHLVLAAAMSALLLLGISHMNFVYPRNIQFMDCKIFSIDESVDMVVHLSIRSKETETWYNNNLEVPTKPGLVYSTQEAFLYMDDDMKAAYNIQETALDLSSSDSACFGDAFQQSILFHSFHANDETLLRNFILHKYKSKGFLKNSSGKIVDLASYRPTRGKFVRKLGIVVSTLITFLTLSVVVEFTLNETQMKMVDFTFKLKDHVRNDIPLTSLVITHILNILLFVPLTIGVLYMLQQVVFSDDIYMSFGVLSLVWFIQAYTAICVRSYPSTQFFPKTQLLYYALFYFYAQLYPYGFTHIALSVNALFSFHSMLFYFNRYELPAVQAGVIHADRPRANIYRPRLYNRRVVVREVAGSRRVAVGVDSRGVPLPQRASRPPTPTATTSIARSPSNSSMFGIQSRSTSANSFMMYEDGVSDDEEYVVYLNGEVVLPARSAVVRRRSDLTPEANDTQ